MLLITNVNQKNGRFYNIAKNILFLFLFLTALKQSICIYSFIDRIRKSPNMKNGFFRSYNIKSKNDFAHLCEIINFYMDKEKKNYETKMR